MAVFAWKPVDLFDQAQPSRLRSHRDPFNCPIAIPVFAMTIIYQPLHLISRRAYGIGSAVDTITIKCKVIKRVLTPIVIMQNSHAGVIPPVLIKIPAALRQAHHFRRTVSARTY
jgi:hypothetical protein